MTSWQVCCYLTSSPSLKRSTYFIILKMTVDFSRDVMLGMLRKGQTGTQILDILNVIVPEQSEVQSENVTEEVAA
jgi:hypothetical protein